MALSDDDRKNVEKQITEIEDQITEQAVTGEGIDNTLAELEIAEKFNKKIWNQNHLGIHNYELEMEGLVGEFVTDPLSENDVVSLANSSGRLYQNPVSTDAKRIPQFDGAPRGFGRVRELENIAEIFKVTDKLRNGTGNTGISTELVVAYTAGDPTISLENSLPNGWIVVDKRILIKIESAGAGGFCTGEDTPPQTTQVACEADNGTWTASESYTIVDRIVDGDALEETFADPNWAGFDNTERTNKVATDPLYQVLLDGIIAELSAELTVWQGIFQSKTLPPVLRNKAENMDAIDKAQHIADDAYLTAYLAAMPVQDGTPGIDELETTVTARDTFRSVRTESARTAKAEYYGVRYDYTNLRADVQSGSLKRILFLGGLQTSGGFKPGGTVQQQKALKTLKKLLE